MLNINLLLALCDPRHMHHERLTNGSRTRQEILGYLPADHAVDGGREALELIVP